MKILAKKAAWKPLANLTRDRRGLSTVEYVIILGLIAAAGISLWPDFGGLVTDRIGVANGQMENVKL